MSTRGASEWRQSRLREIPPVNVVLHSSSVQALLRSHRRELVADAVSDTLRAVREQIACASAESELSPPFDLTPEALGCRVREHLDACLRPSLRRVVNATGIVLHTNLGRAPLADEALAQILEIATRYNNLE